ncbi:hypothetical protein [Halobacillus karajensis]|uniref:Uncharacterized protein n=1 Tax=Halobacillus karajensis TaxID=195088 RepID=A0A024P295_9BACI|nr:hypothetical protein [Halobacillus karajensis]CDQ19939.1 hypothetical protein BN982_02246 [Halobacillus karajensis]CDQ22399.1 hypothetical protein BN983_00607 [Halobacillus karajensis]CDQ28242.1 hypothetical protein BN981_02536 [Halobacillus karajensis]
MNFQHWFDTTFLDETIGWLDQDLLNVFGLKPEYVQFGLVFSFMVALMWVVKPVIEWIMIHHWKDLSSYITCVLLALVFLQLVDRYAMSDTQSTLPHYYWSVCLLALSSYGIAYVTGKWVRKLFMRISRRNKRKAA